METLKSLGERLSKPIVGRIINRFGNILVDGIIEKDMSDQEIFRRLSEGRGKGKPHSRKNYIHREGKAKNS